MNVVFALTKCCTYFFRRSAEASDVGNVRKGNDFCIVADGIYEQVDNLVNGASLTGTENRRVLIPLLATRTSHDVLFDG